MQEPNSENLLTPPNLTGEPLFDDEQTILSARRVVPLERIDKKLKVKSRWFIASAFAVAISLGGASGLVSAYFKLKEVHELGVVEGETQAAFEVPLVATVPDGALNEESNASLLPVPDQQVHKLVISKRVVRPKAVTPRAPDWVISQPMSEDEELLRIRQAVLINDGKGQGRRRVEQRERPRSERKHSATSY
jgi:hypothetical protein